MKKTILILGVLGICNLVHAQTSGTMTDSRDDMTYKTISFENNSSGASITWMAQNLNYKTQGSYEHQNNDSIKKDIGLLYTWEGAIHACPEDWHLASDEEWRDLLDEFGGDTMAGEELKSNVGWNASGNGNNRSGFNALPVSFRGASGTFSFFGGGADFWSSTSASDNSAWRYYMYYGYKTVERHDRNKGFAYSCRCVLD